MAKSSRLVRCCRHCVSRKGSQRNSKVRDAIEHWAEWVRGTSGSDARWQVKTGRNAKMSAAQRKAGCEDGEVLGRETKRAMPQKLRFAALADNPPRRSEDL